MRTRTKVAATIGVATGAFVGTQTMRQLNILGRFSAWLYDTFQGRAEKEFLGQARGGLLGGARGRVLDVGAGTGANFPHYPREGVSELVAVEPDRAMLHRARKRARELGLAVELMETGAYPLPFPNQSFDTVVFSLSLCTIPDPEEALREARRVLKPDGRVLFLEHVRAEDPGLARWQDRLAPLWGAVAGGCRPNQDTKALMEKVGLDIDWIVERVEDRIPIAIVRPGIMGAAKLS